MRRRRRREKRYLSSVSGLIVTHHGQVSMYSIVVYREFASESGVLLYLYYICQIFEMSEYALVSILCMPVFLNV